MVTVNVIVLSFLIATAFSAPVKVNDTMTLFHGEDFHILLPSREAEVTFQNGSAPWSPDVVLMRGFATLGGRAKVNNHLSHLVIDEVGEGDEGVYTVKNPEKPGDVRRIKLIVRDCTIEQIIKYGENYHIPLSGVNRPISLEYRPSAVEANQTSRPALVVLTTTGKSLELYQGRISVTERYVTLSAVTGADEGSYTVRDNEGVIQRKVCLRVKVYDTMTLFHGEDFHILLPSHEAEVTFQNGSAPWLPDVVLMRGLTTLGGRAKVSNHLSHLVIDEVGEGDEGVYTVKNPEKPGDVRRIKLIVRDCTIEQIIKYGENYHIPLSGVNRPISLEYRPSAVEANQTSRPALVVLTTTGTSLEPYQGRISVTERYVTLSAVTGADEGSYTVRDNDGVIQRKVCLNVKEHQNFVTLSYGKRLKINLILNSSLVQLYYTPKNDLTPRLLLEKGEFISAQTELSFGDRLSMEGSLVFLDQVKAADAGQFKITDILGFTVSIIHLNVQPYRLESLYVAIIALLGLLVFLLLVCLLSCLIKVKKRAKRAAALEKIAQNAGKEDEGEAFRQVVKNITKLSEESKHSQADNTEKSQSTEVDIKGLEVSSKEVGVGNLETSDSGVGFNTALPLDTDTDAPDQIPDSEAASISVAPETKASPPSAPESKPSAPPAMEIKPSPVSETKVSPAPETKKTPDQPVEVKLDVPKPADVKPSPAPSPEPKAGLSPADPKPAPSPSPEPKPAVPKATTPTPESKTALAPTPDPPKPTTPEPITNGTPEPGPDSKPSPDHADIIGGSAPKAVPPKTPEVELKSSGAVVEASKDGKVAEDSTTTT